MMKKYFQYCFFNIFNIIHIVIISVIFLASLTDLSANESKLSASITFKGIDDKGIIIENPEFKITTNVSFRIQPLLKYVFFDENSATISKRYFLMKENNTNDFFEANLYRMTLISSYHHILNIIGRRMRDYPSSRLTIKGYNSNEGKEKNNLELSKRRAESVREYFTDIWKIDKSRFSIEHGNLPMSISYSDDMPNLAQEENRRVEFESDDDRILSSIVAVDTSRSAYPATIRFFLKSVSDSGLSRWDFRADNFHKYEDNSRPDIEEAILPEYIDWKLTSNYYLVPREQKPISFSLEITDNSTKRNKFSTSTQIIPIIIFNDDKIKYKEQNNKEIAEFSLILFPYDKADVSMEHQKTIDWIKHKQIVKSNSIIRIAGHSDIIGNAVYNKRLSEKRARTVENVMRTIGIVSNSNKVDVRGFGEEKSLYNNNFPEGRFYSRTVRITIENDIAR